MGKAEVEMNILHLATTYTPFVNGGTMINPTLLAGRRGRETLEGKGNKYGGGNANQFPVRKCCKSPRRYWVSAAKIEGVTVSWENRNSRV